MLKTAEIAGYEGLYTIREDGLVTTVETGNERRAKDDGHKYLRIGLNKDGVCTKHYLHRLLAAAFLDNPEGKATVNHIDGNRRNNSLENLEWATQAENIQHARDTGLARAPRAHLKLTESDAKMVKELHKAGMTNTLMGKLFGVSQVSISQIVTGKTFKYA